MLLRIISFRWAVILALLLFTLLSFVHVAILIALYRNPGYPLNFIWGGRMTGNLLITLEWTALIISVLSFLIILWRARGKKGLLLARAAVILLLVYYALNTVGNLFSETTAEKTISILSVFLAFLCLRIAIEPPDRSN
jgi:hypothetical protein